MSLHMPRVTCNAQPRETARGNKWQTRNTHSVHAAPRKAGQQITYRQLHRNPKLGVPETTNAGHVGVFLHARPRSEIASHGFGKTGGGRAKSKGRKREAGGGERGVGGNRETAQDGGRQCDSGGKQSFQIMPEIVHRHMPQSNTDVHAFVCMYTPAERAYTRAAPAALHAAPELYGAIDI